MTETEHQQPAVETLAEKPAEGELIAVQEPPPPGDLPVEAISAEQQQGSAIMAINLGILAAPGGLFDQSPQGFSNALIAELPEDATVLNVLQTSATTAAMYYSADHGRATMPMLIVASLTGQPTPEGWQYCGTWHFIVTRRKPLIHVAGSPGKQSEVETLTLAQHVHLASCPTEVYDKYKAGQAQQQAGAGN